MRAVVHRTIGGPEAIEVTDAAIPEPGELQVRIRVDAAAINPVDVAAVLGAFGSPPEGAEYGLGWDVAGTIDAVGPGLNLPAGLPVMAIVHGRAKPSKGQAEYVVVDLFAFAGVPRGLDPVLAATLPLNALTAAQSLELLALERGQTLLVTGAAGAVGGYAIELAKRQGLEVVALAGTSDEPAVERLGADRFIERTDDPASAVREAFPGGLDGVLDTAMLGAEALAAVRDGGRYVTTRADAVPHSERGVLVRVVGVSPDASRLTTIADLAAAGKLTPRVALTLPLERAADAYAAALEPHVRGKIVLTTGR